MITWSDQRYAQVCLDILTEIQNDSYTDGLKGLLREILHRVRARAVAVVSLPQGSTGDVDVLWSLHRGEQNDGLFRRILRNQEFHSRLFRLATTGEAIHGLRRSPYCEVLALTFPRYHHRFKDSRIIICIVDRLIGRMLDSYEPVPDSEPLLVAQKTLLKQAEWYRSVFSVFEARIGELPRADTPGAATIDPELLCSVDRILKAWPPWMSIREFGRVVRVLDDLTAIRDERRHSIKGPRGETLSNWIDALRKQLLKNWPAEAQFRALLGIDPHLCAPGEVALTIAYWSRWLRTGSDTPRRVRRDWSEIDRARERLAVTAISEIDPSKDLTTRALGLHFLGRALEWSPSRRAYWHSVAPSGGELTQAFSSIATLAHHLLGQTLEDQQTIESLVWMLSEYVHHELGLPQQFDLRTHLALAAREEPALHVLRRFYRNHFFHAIEVCFLGHFLLELEVKKDTQLWQVVQRKLGGMDKKRLLGLWYLAALFHDIGYAVEIIKGLSGLCRHLGNKPPLNLLPRQLDDCITSLSKALGDEMFLGLRETDRPGEDHGVVAARHLQFVVEEMHREDGTFDERAYDAAIGAIAAHNSARTISFNEKPLSVLLALCDAIQEWKRPALPFITGPMLVNAWLLEGEGHRSGLLTPLRRARINAIGVQSGTTRKFQLDKGASALRFTLEFDDQIAKNWGVFELWLGLSYNIQRLDLRGFALEIEIEIVTPQFKDNDRHRREPNLHRLRDAVRETHMAFVERWFPDGPSPSGTGAANQFMTYERDDRASPPSERIVFNVRKLAGAKPLTKSMAAVREYLGRWRKRDAGWTFDGDYGAESKL